MGYALGLLHLVLALLALEPTIHSGGDNAAYLALSRSLLERGTYQELWDPAMRAHTQFPPGFPGILALAQLAGLKPWLGFKLVIVAFSAAAVTLSYLWARRATTPGVALATGIVLATAPGVLDLSHWELSDVPFWAFTMAALWGFARLDPYPQAQPPQEAPHRRRRLGVLAFTAVATLFAHLTRSAALPLVVAGAGWLAWRRRWRDAALYVGVIMPFALAWWIRGRMVGAAGYTSHLWAVDPYRPDLGLVTPLGMLERVTRNLARYTGEKIPELLIGRQSDTFAVAVGVVVLGLAVGGWVLRLRRGRIGVAEAWLPLYIALLLIWPSQWASARFLLPALPFMLVSAGDVIRELGRAVREPVMLGAGLTALLVVVGAPQVAGEVRQGIACRQLYRAGQPDGCMPPPWGDLFKTARDLRDKLPRGSNVLVRKPTLFWALSGYPGRPYPFSTDPDTLLAAAREARARYVVLDYYDNLSPMYLTPAVMQRPQAFCVMYTLGAERASVFGILPGAERMPNVRDRPGTETATIAFPPCPTDFWQPGALPSEPPPP